MSRRGTSGRAPPTPLDGAGLDRLAIGYVGRYATTRTKLARYLARKLAERGWAGEGLAPVEAVVARCAALGYVDDAAFASGRAAALARRGYGPARVRAALRAAGVASPAPAEDDAGDRAAALAFARRRRIGPYAPSPRDPDQQRRDLAAMMRAGHGFALARAVIGMGPGEEDDPA